MQVFKTYFKIVKTKLTSVIMFYVIFLSIAIAMPLLDGGKETKEFTQTSLEIAVENSDEGELGVALVSYLEKANQVTKAPEDEDELLDAVYYRDIDYVLYIPKDFTERFVNGEREGLLVDKKVPSTTNGEFGDRQIENYLKTAGLYLDGGFSLEECIALTEENLDITAEVKYADNTGIQAKEGAFYYYQYFAYVIMSATIMLIGPLLLAFEKKDVEARNRCSSKPFLSLNMQIVAASVVVVLIEYALVVLVGGILYPDYTLSVKGLLSAVNASAITLVALALAYLSAQIAKKEEVLNMASNVFGLTFAFLGGVFVPLEIFGEKTLVVSRFTPTYWYVTANETISQMSGIHKVMGAVGQSVIIELLYAFALLALGLLVKRTRARG